MRHEELANVPLFDGMSEDELAAVAGLFHEVHVRSGDELTHEDEHGHTFFVVLDGNFRVKVDDDAVAELGPGDHFGEIALVRGERRNATVKAIDSCRVAKMMNWDFNDLMATNAALASRIEAAAAERERD